MNFFTGKCFFQDIFKSCKIQGHFSDLENEIIIFQVFQDAWEPCPPHLKSDGRGVLSNVLPVLNNMDAPRDLNTSKPLGRVFFIGRILLNVRIMTDTNWYLAAESVSSRSPLYYSFCGFRQKSLSVGLKIPKLKLK